MTFPNTPIRNLRQEFFITKELPHQMGQNESLKVILKPGCIIKDAISIIGNTGSISQEMVQRQLRCLIAMFLKCFVTVLPQAWSIVVKTMMIAIILLTMIKANIPILCIKKQELYWNTYCMNSKIVA